MAVSTAFQRRIDFRGTLRTTLASTPSSMNSIASPTKGDAELAVVERLLRVWDRLDACCLFLVSAKGRCTLPALLALLPDLTERTVRQLVAVAGNAAEIMVQRRMGPAFDTSRDPFSSPSVRTAGAAGGEAGARAAAPDGAAEAIVFCKGWAGKSKACTP